MGTGKPALLADPEITIALATLPEWSRDGDAITRTVEAPSFLDGIELVRKVAHAAEEADHHPDIDIRWRTVRFTLSTHSAGGLTALDTAMAHHIDTILA
ncbi:4a-hydroxytetrahydrobiopterin dehydratase [Nocardia rhizosphaerae]|uniref:Putative pterin-4-alpha-carbinolamine dehydratase n=1 Tax=Nocardia rhizosphaerae TaxID=1691571 RepID=A0ABV8L4D5_9NOCA